MKLRFPQKIWCISFWVSHPLNLRHHLFCFFSTQARHDKRSIPPTPSPQGKRRNMFLLLHFYSLLTEIMFSSLFQHFGKGERERERERGLCILKWLCHHNSCPCHYLRREGGGKKKWQKEVPSTKQRKAPWA